MFLLTTKQLSKSNPNTRLCPTQQISQYSGASVDGRYASISDNFLLPPLCPRRISGPHSILFNAHRRHLRAEALNWMSPLYLVPGLPCVGFYLRVVFRHTGILHFHLFYWANSEGGNTLYLHSRRNGKAKGSQFSCTPLKHMGSGGTAPLTLNPALEWSVSCPGRFTRGQTSLVPTK
jgi:hypothetical protein